MKLNKYCTRINKCIITIVLMVLVIFGSFVYEKTEVKAASSEEETYTTVISGESALDEEQDETDSEKNNPAPKPSGKKVKFKDTVIMIFWIVVSAIVVGDLIYIFVRSKRKKADSDATDKAVESSNDEE